MNFMETLQARRVFLDGAMGTLLQKYGLKPGESPMDINKRAREAITEIHRQYLAAGADVITANTFGAYTHQYPDAPWLIEAAMENARQAVQGGGGYIALDMGPTGRLMKPMGDMDFEEGYGLFKSLAQTGADCGADLIIVETMADLRETKAAVLAAKETGLPVLVSMTFDERGRTLTGADIACMSALLLGLSADAIGMNCGFGPDLYRRLLPTLLSESDLPLLLQPNAGLPVITNGVAHYQVTPEDFAECMSEMATLGIRILGGCCGTTPAHIQAMVNKVGKAPIAPMDQAKKRGGSLGAKETPDESRAHAQADKDTVTICSGSRAVKIAPDADREALSLAVCVETEIDDMIDEAMELAESAEIVEIWIQNPVDVEAVQEMVRVPLSLDADSAAVLAAAVRKYDGRPMINKTARALSGDADLKKTLESYGAVII